MIAQGDAERERLPKEEISSLLPGCIVLICTTCSFEDSGIPLAHSESKLQLRSRSVLARQFSQRIQPFYV